MAACAERAAGIMASDAGRPVSSARPGGPSGTAWDPRGYTAELQPDLGGRRRLARVAAAENQVLHAVAAQAAGALLAEHPRQRVDDVALAAAVRADNRRHALLEGQLRAVGKALETRDFETLEPHEEPGSLKKKPPARRRHTPTRKRLGSLRLLSGFWESTLRCQGPHGRRHTLPRQDGPWDRRTAVSLTSPYYMGQD